MISPRRVAARFLEDSRVAASPLLKKVQDTLKKSGLKIYKSAPGLAGSAGDGSGDFRAYEWDGKVNVAFTNRQTPKDEKAKKAKEAVTALKAKGLDVEEKVEDGQPKLIVSEKKLVLGSGLEICFGAPALRSVTRTKRR